MISTRSLGLYATATIILMFAAAPRALAGSSVPGTWDDCGLEPWDPVLEAPKQPVKGRSAQCATSGYFRVVCGDGPCVSAIPPHVPPMIQSQRMEVVDGKCVQVGETEFVNCDQIVELRLLPPACPKTATSARTAIVHTADGIAHISGETLRLSMDFDFSCGTFHCESDPATQVDPTHPGHPLLCAPKPQRCKVAPCVLPPPFALTDL